MRKYWRKLRRFISGYRIRVRDVFRTCRYPELSGSRGSVASPTSHGMTFVKIQVGGRSPERGKQHQKNQAKCLNNLSGKKTHTRGYTTLSSYPVSTSSVPPQRLSSSGSPLSITSGRPCSWVSLVLVLTTVTFSLPKWRRIRGLNC